MRLLIVEDDNDLSSALARGFREEGFAVDVAENGEDGLHLARSGDYDIVLLDLMLPGMNGFRVLETLRGEDQQVPVIFLTARGEVEDRVRGLRLGGDDYLVKPFSFDELLARIRSVMRRASGRSQNYLEWGGLRMEQDAHRVTWKGVILLEVTPTEYKILEALMLNQGAVLSRTRLSTHVYDNSFECDSNVIDAHVANLRKKLFQMTGERIIETVRGVGFQIPDRPQ